MLCTTLFAYLLIETSALVPSTGGKGASNISRRGAFGNVVASISGGALTSLLTTSIQPADAADKGPEVFVGTYSDPNNHPGGTRTIRLLNKKFGDYNLVEINGGGGRGEPKEYTLPGVAIGGRAIIIDFTPKGGPPDFTAVIDDKTGGLRFLKDGNVWPRIS